MFWIGFKLNFVSNSAHLDVELNPIARWPKATRSCSTATKDTRSIVINAEDTRFSLILMVLALHWRFYISFSYGRITYLILLQLLASHFMKTPTWASECLAGIPRSVSMNNNIWGSFGYPKILFYLYKLVYLMFSYLKNIQLATSNKLNFQK
jgi:hypothetical protein